MTMPASIDVLLVLASILTASGYLLYRSLKRTGCEGCGTRAGKPARSATIQIKLPGR